MNSNQNNNPQVVPHSGGYSSPQEQPTFPDDHEATPDTDRWTPEDSDRLRRVLVPQTNDPDPISTDELAELVFRMEDMDRESREKIVAEIAAQANTTSKEIVERFARNVDVELEKLSTASPQPLSAAPEPHQPRTTPTAAPPQPDNTHAAPPPPPKQKPKNPGHQSDLDDLNPDQIQLLDKVIAESSRRNAAHILSGPPPTGLGFPVSQWMIHRYQGRQRREELQREKEEIEETAKLLLNTGDDSQISNATKRHVRNRLLRYVTQSGSSIEAVIDLTLKADRLRLTELSERRLALAEKKLQAQTASPSS